jgi:hypothetical protein
VSRQRPSLEAPDATTPLDRFPAFALLPTRALWRVTRDGHGPWWFGSTMEGRFDLPAPEGTCYLASDDLGALLEVLGPDLLPGSGAPWSLLTGRHLRELRAPHRLRLADAVAEKAVAWVTGELSTITPYRVPQAWARALRRTGFEGIRYAARHRTARRPFAVALFGSAGERHAWNAGRRVAIGDDHRERLAARCGVVLFDVPAEDELVFETDSSPPG